MNATSTTVFRFRALSLANSFAARCAKPQQVIMGDDGFFWVVTLAVAACLLGKGYELAQ